MFAECVRVFLLEKAEFLDEVASGEGLDHFLDLEELARLEELEVLNERQRSEDKQRVKEKGVREEAEEEFLSLEKLAELEEQVCTYTEIIPILLQIEIFFQLNFQSSNFEILKETPKLKRKIDPDQVRFL